MNKEIKQKWVDALKSGEYKQGRYQLYIPGTNKYCCLGVLCRVANIEISPNGSSALDENKKDVGYNPIKRIVHGDDETASLRTLTRMNDYENLPFFEIADYIEKNL